MATITLLNAQTAAATVTIDARAYDKVLLAAGGLAGAEVVDLKIGGGANWALVTQPDDSPSQLTAARQSLELPGGYYQLTKSVSAGAVSIEATTINL